MKIIAIAGGSGSGKSTVSYALVDAIPDIFEVINFDDYQKLSTDPTIPMLEGMINWDHPDVIHWDKLISDLQKLDRGTNVIIDSWAHRSNPDYGSSDKMIPRTIHPRPIMILEGNLALYNPELNKLYHRSYYFDLDNKIRHSRRDKDIIIGEEDYITKVLEPMHNKYVEPTKEKADLVINVNDRSVAEIAKIIKDDLDHL